MKNDSIGKRFFLMLLTLSAGFTDAYVYIYGKAFPANMTGNSVILASAFGKENIAGAITPAFSILGFVAGTMAGSLMLYRKSSVSGGNLLIGRVLLLEAIILSLAEILFRNGSGATLALISLTSAAMGLQGIAMYQFGIKGISTITLTNTITTAVSNLVNKEISLFEKQPSTQFNASLQLVTWVVYVAGAAGAACLVNNHFTDLLLVPAGLTLVSVFLYSFLNK